jgi:type I restriction enzyme S subunit
LPEGWAWSKINNIAFVTKLAGFEYSKYIAPTLCEEGIPLFKGKNVQDSKIIYEFESFIPESISDELSRSQITRKCILTPYVGTIGNIGIHDKVGKFHLGSNVGKIELYNSCVVLMEEYVVTYLKSSFGYKQLTKHMKATAQASISIEAIRDVYIPIPPENEQQRMWSAISESLALIENIESYECNIADMVKLAKAKILDLAIRGKLVPQNPDDEPASALLERIRAEKEELIKQGKIKRDKKESVIFKGEDNSYYRMVGKNKEVCEDIPFELPKGWIWTTLGQYCEKVTDQVASGSFAALRENVLSFKEPSYALMVKTADFANNFTKNLTYTDKHGYEFLENSNLFGGELILSNIGSIGKVFIVPKLNCKMTLAPNSVMVRFVNEAHRDYIYNYLSSPLGYDQLISITSGAAVLKFNKTDLKTIYIPVPPLAEQTRIIETIELLFEKLEIISESLN